MGVMERYENRNKKKKEEENKKSALGVAERFEMNNFKASLPEKLESLTSLRNEMYNGYNSRFFDKDGNYINAYRGDTRDALTSFETSKTRMDNESKAILDSLSTYENYLDADTVKGLRKYLTGYSSDLDGMYETYKSDHDYFSQFADEDSYKRALSYTKEQADKKTKYSAMSDDELEAEIKRLEDSKKGNKLTNFAMKFVGAQNMSDSNNLYAKGEANQDYNDSVDYDISLIEKEKTNRKYKQIDELPGDVKSLVDELTEIEATNKEQNFSDAISSMMSAFGQQSQTSSYSSYDLEKHNRHNEIIKELEDKGVDNWRELVDYNTFRYNEEKNAPAKEQYAQMAKEHPVLSSAISIPASLSKGFGVLEMIENVGSDVPLDPNSPYFAANNLSNTVRETVMDENDFYLNTGNEIIDNIDVFDELYSTGMSMGDSLMAGVGLAGGGGFALGLSAASDSAQEVAENGGSASKAITTGLVSGLNEMLWESLSLGKLDELLTNGVSKRGFKGFVQATLKSMGINASEELNTEAANLLADYVINGGASTYVQAVQNYLSLGYSTDEAKSQAGKDMLTQIGKAGIGGALQGLFMGGGASGISTAATEIENKVYENKFYNQAGRNVIDNNNLSQLVEQAKGLGSEKSLKALKDLADKVSGVKTEELDTKGSKKYAHQVGKLYKGVTEAQLKSLGKSNETAFKNVIKEELESAGVDNIDEATEILTKAMYNQGLTRAESQKFQSINGREILNKALSSAEFRENRIAEEKKQEQADARKVIETTVLPHDKSNKTKLDELTDTEGYKISTNGKTTIDATDEEVKINKITSFDTDTDDVSVELNTGVNLSVSELNIDENTAVIVNGLKKLNAEGLIDVDTANYIMGMATRGNVKMPDFMIGAMDSIRYGSIGYEGVLEKDAFTKVIPEDIRKDLFNRGKKFSEQKAENKAKNLEKQRQERIDSGKGKVRASGNVKFDGVNYKDLNNSQKAQVELLEVVFSEMGINLEFFASPVVDGVRKGKNGSYNPRTNTIRLDVFAGNKGEGLMLFTAAHELTHFIREWSPAKFKAFADFLIKRYAENDISVKSLINAKISDAKKKGRKMTFDEAYEEVVADACESFLRDSNAKDALVALTQVDESLSEKIIRWIKDFVKLIENAINALNGKNPESKESQYVLNELKSDLSKLHDLWDVALLDARETAQWVESSKTAQKNTTDEGDVKQQARKLQRKDPTKLKESDLLQLLNYVKNKILADDTYIPVRVNTPQILIEFAKECGYDLDSYPLAMRVYKARQSVSNEEEWDGNPQDKPHDLSYEEVIGIIKAMDNPSHLVFQTENERFAEIVKFERDGGREKAYAIVDFFDGNKNPDIMNGYEGGAYNTLVTIYPSEDPVKLRNYLSNKKHKVLTGEEMKKKGLSQGSYGSNVPSLLNDSPFFEEIITNPTEKVNSANEKRQDRPVVNQSMTMAEAKDMVQRAFVLGGIYEWYDGEYKNGDEWLREQGADEVALYIENEYALQQKYLDKIQGLLDEEFYVQDILNAYLNRTLVGKEKPKAKRLDTSVNYRINDTRFYSPQRIDDVKKLFAIAGQKMTAKNRAEVSNARAKILLFAHNKGTSELLGLSQAELNKKLRSWSGYTNRARETSERLNNGVADSNKWTGIENCSWLYRSQVTTEELESLVKNIEGAASDYEKMYIARTMLALDTHIDWSWLSFEFDTNERVNKNHNGNSRVLGFYRNDGRKIVVSHNQPNTVAHEMGRALDYQWARDLGYQYDALTTVYRNTERITDADTKQFFDNFKIFMDSLTDNGDIRSEYTQDPKEVFARFVARFIQWVDNTGGNRSYTTEIGYYNDKFTASNYIEFVKLLQEKAMLDAKRMSEDVKFQDRPYQPSPEDLGIDYKAETDKLKADVDRLNKLLKLQKTLTHGASFTKTSVEKAASLIMREFDLHRGKSELAEKLNALYTFMASSDELTWDEIYDRASQIANWIIDSKPEKFNYKNPYASEILKDIRERGITFNEKQKEEAAYIAGTFNAYRKINIGNFKIVNEGGIPLTDLWEQLVNDYPGAINQESIEKGKIDTNIPSLIVELIEDMRQTESILEQMDRTQEVRKMVEKIYDTYWNVTTLHTLADRHQKEINLLKGKHRAEMDALKEKTDTKVKNTKEHYREMLQKVREDRDAKMQTYKERVQEQKRKNVEGRNKTATKNKIKRVIKTLESLYSNPTKENNVKKEMQEMVRKALVLVDVLFNDCNSKISAVDILSGEITVRMSPKEKEVLEKWRDAYKAWQRNRDRLDALEASNKVNPKIHDELLDNISKCNNKLNRLARELSDVVEAEKGNLNREAIKSAVDSLAKAYRSLNESTEGYAKAAYNEYVDKRLTALQDSLDGVTAKNITQTQLEELYQAYKMVLTTVRTANEIFVKNKRMSVTDMGEAVIAEVEKVAKVTDSKIAKLKEIREFSWEELIPVYAFERIGSDTFMELYKEVLRGQDVYGRDIADAQRFFQEKSQKYDFDSWDFKERKDFILADGRTFSINLDEIMAIYAYSRRGEQAIGHITGGGFVFDSSKFFTETKEKGLKGKIKRERTTVEAYKLVDDVFYKIINSLTEEQKRFAEDMQGYLSDMGAKGNEVSRVLYGIDIFNEKYYFPLMSSQDFINQPNEPVGMAALRNWGATKPTVPHAQNPIILKGFMDVWNEHVNKMSVYHSMVLPIENLNKVYNYTGYAQNNRSVSIKTILKGAYGEEVNKYIENFITDLNGGIKVQSSGGKLIKLMGNFKKTAVAASSSVVVQQPTAIVRAMAMIKGKYFVHGTDGLKHKEAWEQIKKYAPIAIIKEMGGFDVGGSQRVADYITAKSYDGIKDKAKGFFTDKNYRGESPMWLASKADETAWIWIWNAVQEEIAHTTTYEKGSEEFFKACGERFTEVVDYTQVYDSVLSRSGFMRNKGEISKMATAFMGEPTKSVNMMFNAVLQAKRKNIRKRDAGRIIGATFGSILLAAIAKSFIYALRDDDEDESYAEKYAQAFAGSFISDVHIHNMLPYIKDIISIFKGWDVERTDMTIIKDIWDAWNGLESKSKAPQRKIEDFVGAIASAFGIPAKNILRSCREIYNLFKNLLDDNTLATSDIGEAAYEGAYGEITASDMNEQLNKGNTDKAKETMQKLISEKVESGKTKKEAKASLKSSVTAYWKPLYLEAYQDGDTDEMYRIRKLLASLGIYDSTADTCSNWIKSSKDN